MNINDSYICIKTWDETVYKIGNLYKIKNIGENKKLKKNEIPDGITYINMITNSGGWFGFTISKIERRRLFSDYFVSCRKLKLEKLFFLKF